MRKQKKNEKTGRIERQTQILGQEKVKSFVIPFSSLFVGKEKKWKSEERGDLKE